MALLCVSCSGTAKVRAMLYYQSGDVSQHPQKNVVYIKFVVGAEESISLKRRNEQLLACETLQKILF